MKFEDHTLHLEIETGNDAMTTAEDLARAVEGVAADLRAGQQAGNIRDLNGNGCGTWWLEEDEC